MKLWEGQQGSSWLSLLSTVLSTVTLLVQELDTQQPQHVEFWEALRLIADLELAEAIKQDKLDWARLRGENIPAEYRTQRTGVHEAVDKDIQHMLAGMAVKGDYLYDLQNCC